MAMRHGWRFRPSSSCSSFLSSPFLLPPSPSLLLVPPFPFPFPFPSPTPLSFFSSLSLSLSLSLPLSLSLSSPTTSFPILSHFSSFSPFPPSPSEGKRYAHQRSISRHRCSNTQCSRSRRATHARRGDLSGAPYPRFPCRCSPWTLASSGCACTKPFKGGISALCLRDGEEGATKGFGFLAQCTLDNQAFFSPPSAANLSGSKSCEAPGARQPVWASLLLLHPLRLEDGRSRPSESELPCRLSVPKVRLFD